MRLNDMADGMTDIKHEFKKMDLLADIRRRGVIEGLRLAEEIAANSIGARPREIAEAIRAKREKVENT